MFDGKSKGKCPVCEYKIKDDEFVFCPICGGKLDSALNAEEYNVDRLRYVLGLDKGGRFFYENFSVAKQMGSYQWIKIKDVRRRLSDFHHIFLLNLHANSLLHSSARVRDDLYTVSKFFGHCSVGEALKTMKIQPLVNTLSGSKLFWKVFENKLVQKMFKEGYGKIGAMHINRINIDKEAKSITWVCSDSPLSTITAEKPACFMTLGCLCGQSDVVFNGIWEGRETKCQAVGDEYCEFELTLHEKEEKPDLEEFSKKRARRDFRETYIKNSIPVGLNQEDCGRLFPY